MTTENAARGTVYGAMEMVAVLPEKDVKLLASCMVALIQVMNLVSKVQDKDLKAQLTLSSVEDLGAFLLKEFLNER